MSKQGYTPNFKWSMADVYRVAALARKGWTAKDICMELRGTKLASMPYEIVALMADMNIRVRFHRLER
jgi:hypothetical protein